MVIRPERFAFPTVKTSHLSKLSVVRLAQHSGPRAAADLIRMGLPAYKIPIKIAALILSNWYDASWAVTTYSPAMDLNALPPDLRTSLSKFLFTSTFISPVLGLGIFLSLEITDSFSTALESLYKPRILIHWCLTSLFILCCIQINGLPYCCYIVVFGFISVTLASCNHQPINLSCNVMFISCKRRERCRWGMGRVFIASFVIILLREKLARVVLTETLNKLL